MNDDAPCKVCTHSLDMHFKRLSDKDVDKNVICLACVVDKDERSRICWHDFVCDNLAYFEQEAKRRGLVK